MVMRVGGIVSGMDIEAMVNKLMEAERMPLIRMEQDRTKLEWKRDAFREINMALAELEQLLSPMKRPSTYRSKLVTSSQEYAVRATGNASTADGIYQIEVKNLATSAINVGSVKGVGDRSVDPDQALYEQYENVTGTFTISTFNDDGSLNTFELIINEEDTLNDVLNRINEADIHVRAFYDQSSNQVVFETTRTGAYNPEDGPEIIFDTSEDSFFTNVLGLQLENEIGGENARFSYNDGLELTSRTNSYNINGLQLTFLNTTEGPARLTVENDVESTFDAIMNFVKTYNNAVEKMNQSQQEQIYRDYPPLTDEQKEEMTESQIELWEERAKSGLLRGETVIQNGMFNMRQSWYATVDTGRAITTLTHIGITTSENYLDGGKLEVDEEKLRAALQEDPEGVERLLIQTGSDENKGLIHRLGDSLQGTMRQIERRAGKSTHTLDNYTLGRRMKELNERISDFEAKMVRVETRYWNQFTRMEKAIQRLNDQSSYLFSQFGS